MTCESVPCLHGGHRRRRVRVGVEGQDLGADEVLYEGERAARRHVVAVHDGADAVRAGEGGVGADQAGPDQARYFGPLSPCYGTGITIRRFVLLTSVPFLRRNFVELPPPRRLGSVPRCGHGQRGGGGVSQVCHYVAHCSQFHSISEI